MRRATSLHGVLVLLALAGGLAAQDGPKPLGKLQLNEKSYNLSHVAVYELKTDDGKSLVLLASSRKLPIEKLKAQLREEDEQEGRFLSQPYLRVKFNDKGEVEGCSASADNSSFSTTGSLLTGEIKVEGGKATGKATLKEKPDSRFKSSFEIEFAAPLVDPNAPAQKEKPAGPPPKPTVTGDFKGNGKPAKLAFVSAHAREPFSDKPALTLVFTEKDHSKEKRPDFKAGFGDFGSALIISVNEDGGIFGCEVAHAAHEKKPFSSLGKIRMEDFEAGEDRVQGEITTDGESEAFGQTWQVNLKFAAPYKPLPSKPAETKPADKKVAAKKPAKKPADDDDDDDADEDDEDNPKTASGDGLGAKELALPKDATDIEYKKIVEHIAFKSPAKVENLAADLTKRLGDQGWKKDGSDLVTAKSAILRRKRGDASLTIMLKPAGAGSQATIFTEGLDWEK